MSLSLLLVEDDVATRAPLNHLLQSRGYHVTTALGAEPARELLSVLSFDVVITDIHMPDGSGLDLIRFLRARYPRTRIIAMTGRSPVELQSELTAAACTVETILPKPFTPDELLAVLNTAAWSA